MNKVSSPYSLKDAQAFIEAHDDFLVVSHVQPDGDAASSTCAVGYLLHQLNKTYTLANEGKLPAKFSYLWGFPMVQQLDQLPADKKFKHVIAVDCADFTRIGQIKNHFAPDYELLNIDHHPTNDKYGRCNLIDEQAAATAEVLYDLIENGPYTWDRHLAACIYTGLLTDTGGFRYANTSPKVMEIASHLLSYGIDANQMAEDLLEKLTMPHIYLLKAALNSLQFSVDQRISWITISERDMVAAQAANEDLEGLVNYPRNIEGVQVGILFKQVNEQTIKVSFRSDGQVNVAEVAQHFQGGGHHRAAGATLHVSLNEAVSAVLAQLQKVMQ